MSHSKLKVGVFDADPAPCRNRLKVASCRKPHTFNGKVGVP